MKDRLCGMWASIGLLIFMVHNEASYAATVYFNDADRGPADTLQIGGVTVTGVGQPTTVAGVGLGVASGVGPASEVDFQLHYSAGSMLADGGVLTAAINLRVDGLITGVTISPVLRIFLGPGEPLMPIGVAMELSTSQLDWPIVGSNSGPVRLSPLLPLPSFYGLNPHPGWDPSVWYYNLRTPYVSQEETLEFGFTVISVDYTPVPEPGGAAFAALGLAAVLLAKRLTGR